MLFGLRVYRFIPLAKASSYTRLALNLAFPPSFTFPDHRSQFQQPFLRHPNSPDAALAHFFLQAARVFEALQQTRPLLNGSYPLHRPSWSGFRTFTSIPPRAIVPVSLENCVSAPGLGLACAMASITGQNAAMGSGSEVSVVMLSNHMNFARNNCSEEDSRTRVRIKDADGSVEVLPVCAAAFRTSRGQKDFARVPFQALFGDSETPSVVSRRGPYREKPDLLSSLVDWYGVAIDLLSARSDFAVSSQLPANLHGSH